MEKLLKTKDGQRINYDIYNPNTTNNPSHFLIFIHGAGADLNSWYRVRKRLKQKNIPNIAIDLRGHGKSSKPQDINDYDFDNFATDIYEIIESEKISNFSIISYCFGGSIAKVFNSKYPNFAKSFIFISSTYKSPTMLKNVASLPLFSKKSLNFMFKKINSENKNKYHLNYSKYIESGDWYYPRIFENIFHTSIKSWMFTYKHFSNYNGARYLKDIRQPVLLLHGNKDTAVDHKYSIEMHKNIKNSKLKILENKNHIILLNSPDLIVDEIMDFISDKN